MVHGLTVHGLMPQDPTVNGPRFVVHDLTVHRLMLHGPTALPPDVRQGSALPQLMKKEIGYAAGTASGRWFGGQARTRGAAQR